MAPLFVRAVAVAWGLLALAANDCFAQSFMDRARSNWQAMQETYPAPDALAGDPAATGLLLVEGYFTWAGGHNALVGVAIVGSHAPDQRILAGGVSTGRRNAAPFAGLAPGLYRIQRFKFSSGAETRISDAPATPEFAVEVRAGEVFYIGQVHASQRMFSTAINFEVESDRARESEAWRRLLERYPGSAWEPLIRARVAELSATAPATP